MSELIQKQDDHTTLRWKLLTGTSALALAACVSSVDVAAAQDNDRPTVWIELGGQLSRLQDSQETFAPAFVALTPSPFSPPQGAETPPRYGFDGTASLAFQPKGSDWTFSASIRYGRANGNKHVHHESYPSAFIAYQQNKKGVRAYQTIFPSAARFTDTVAKYSENYAILDFSAGKDVGLGAGGLSSLNAGLRIAQFQSKSRISLGADPDWRFDVNVANFYGFIIQYALQPYHSFEGAFSADSSFNGIGPSLSWKGSTPIADNADERVFTLDWGVNAALLFGRQKTRTQHETTARYQPPGTGPFPYPDYVLNPLVLYHHAPPPQTRSRNVVVPNIGAFAGLSFKYPNAKISFGYKADFFFGAMDGGIDTRKTYDRNFYGPYAAISIGLGG